MDLTDYPVKYRVVEVHVRRKPAGGRRLPPQSYFMVSAIFHYLGPALAALLFGQIAPLGVAWLRIASAAIVFAIWRGPRRLYRTWQGASPATRRRLVALGFVLAAMNSCFYLAIARIPLATVSTIEFLGPVALAAAGTRTRRNAAALGLAIGGVALLTEVRVSTDGSGLAFAFGNCAMFACYITLGHRNARDGAGTGIDRLAIAMFLAVVAISPIALGAALSAFPRPLLLLAGVGVGVCSSVIPYVLDQLAMARLTRAAFALLMSLLPACATVIGLLVLHQVPRPADIVGIVLVASGVAVRTEGPAEPAPHGQTSCQPDPPP
jgi:inner membrane transporter RhtA